MRNALRLGLAAAVAAVVLPAAPAANAIYCGELLDKACYQVCRVYERLGRPCPR